MIRTEKKKTEKYLFDTLPEALVPIEVTYRSGRLKIESFKKTVKVAKEFRKLFSDSPFSREAKEFLADRLSDTVKKWGYCVDDINEGHIITYMAEQHREELIQGSTVKITSGEGYKNLTDYELLEVEGDECYFVTVIDNKIVSVCETNTADAFSGAKEINVFTAEEYRGMGYGASNVSAMIKHYHSLGHNVGYTSRKDNLSSCKLAEKCGLKQIAETYYFVCYREE